MPVEFWIRLGVGAGIPRENGIADDHARIGADVRSRVQLVAGDACRPMVAIEGRRVDGQILVAAEDGTAVGTLIIAEGAVADCQADRSNDFGASPRQNSTTRRSRCIVDEGGIADRCQCVVQGQRAARTAGVARKLGAIDGHRHWPAHAIDHYRPTLAGADLIG